MPRVYETSEVFFKVEFWDASQTLMTLLSRLEDAIEHARMIEDNADFVEVSGPFRKEEIENV